MYISDYQSITHQLVPIIPVNKYDLSTEKTKDTLNIAYTVT